MAELRIEVCNREEGVSRYKITAQTENLKHSIFTYLTPSAIQKIATDLADFGPFRAHGNIIVGMGDFDDAKIEGAARCIFHLDPRGKVWLNVITREKNCLFAGIEPNQNATFYLFTEATLVDKFVTELHSISSGHSDVAILDAWAA